MRMSRIAIFATVVTFSLSAAPVFATTRSWTGASSALWSAGANWNPAGVPTAGDSLSFPDGAVNLTNTNDLPASTLFTSIAIPGSGYTISGNAIRLSGGMTSGFGVNTFNVPTQLTASQTFTAEGSNTTRLALGGTIDLQANTLTLAGPCTVSGAISGTGGVTIFNTGSVYAYVVLSGVNTYTGPTINNRYLIINGSQPSSEVINRAVLKGTGTIGPLMLDFGQVDPGPTFGPGFNGTGVLHTGSVSVTGSFGHISFDLNGTMPGTDYDQIDVTGTVNVNSMGVSVNNGGSLVPGVGQVFTLIANDGADAVSGTFNEKPEGAILTIGGGAQYRISYQGGGGNDVTLTCTFAPKTWSGAGADNLWSTPANWSGGVAPVDGDGLTFPDGAANLTNVNNLPALTQFTSIAIPGSGYTISGNEIRLSGGMTSGFGVNTFNVPIQLTASQTFTAEGSNTTRFALGGTIDLQANTLTLGGQCTVSGAISGTGGVTIFNTGSVLAYVVLSGTNTYSGPTINDRLLVINGSQLGSAVTSRGILYGTGTIGPLRIDSGTTGGQVAPGPPIGFPGTGVLHTGNLSAIGSFGMFVNLDVNSSADYDGLDVAGTVNLNLISLSMSPGAGFSITPGKALMIVSNDGSDAIVGTFTGKPQNANFNVGTYPMRISYRGGDGNDVVVTTLTNTFATSTSLISSKNPASQSESITFTATVTSASGSPTGTVIFTDNNVSIGSGNISGTTATLPTSTLSPGNHTIRAEYQGDLDFVAGTSSPLAQIIVGPASPGTTTITRTNASLLADGTSATTITVTARDSNGNQLLQSGGAVTLSTTRGTLSSVTDNNNGTYTATLTSSTSPGTATISGTINGAPITSTASVTFSPIAIRLALTAPYPVLGGSPFQINVTATDAGGNTATGYTGTIHFTSSDGVASLPADYTFIAADDGQRMFDVTLNTAGDVAITARDTVNASITGNASVVVQGATNVSINSSVNPSVVGQSVTITAMVTSSTAGAITGTVTFYEVVGPGITPLGSGTISAGSATYTTSTLAQGSHAILAVYEGDAYFYGNNSTQLTQVVNAAPFGPPPLFSATATSTTQVALSWGAVSGAISYEVWRSSFNGPYTLALTTASATSTNDTGRTANTTYLYMVRTIGSSGPSAFSPIDAATTTVFTDPVLASQLIRAVHIVELRIAVNAMRAAAGLLLPSFTDPTLSSGSTLIRAVHIVELRLRLNEARAAIPLSGIVYTDATITPGSTVMKEAHVAEIRAGTQ